MYVCAKLLLGLLVHFNNLKMYHALYFIVAVVGSQRLFTSYEYA
jgi:hypothetical protein